jgi:LmbE family N-acetylglucosaminyl deacetylase
MKSYDRVLAVGAHPDDVEFSCLGYLMKLEQSGSEITVFIASNGSAGDPTSSELRIAESHSSLDCIKSEILCEHTSGISYSDYERLSVRLRGIILERVPNLVLVHSQHDTHQEHKLIREILMTAARRHPCTILSYKSVSVTSSYEENYFVNISDNIEKKISQVQRHKSQSHHEYMSTALIREFHVSWFAKMRGFDFVESYHLEQELI